MIDLLALWGVFPTAATDKRAIQALLQQLQPMSTDKPLIRFGPKADGGYLVPDDLTGIEACFSPGVGAISGFEKDCADRGIGVHLADRSVQYPGAMHELFNFTRKYVGVTTNDDFMTLDGWVAAASLRESSDLMLQMDIEGFEYEVMLGASDRLMSRFRIIVAEVHQLDQLWNAAFFQLASRAFAKILQTHRCVHIHPNNFSRPLKKAGLSIPPLAEFTFLRKDRGVNSGYAQVFPHPLDADNTSRAHFPLPQCWWRQA